MNKKVLHTLEFDKIIEILAGFSTCPGGRRLCEALEPLDDIQDIRNRQKETADALRRILRSGSLSFSGTREIMDSLKRLEIGGSLSTTELLNISSVLQVASRAKSFSRRERDIRTSRFL